MYKWKVLGINDRKQLDIIKKYAQSCRVGTGATGGVKGSLGGAIMARLVISKPTRATGSPH